MDAGVWSEDENGPHLQKGSGPNVARADKNHDNCNTAEL